MKLTKIFNNVLLENNKIEKNIEKLKKLGVNERNARSLAGVASNLSIFFANKILESYKENGSEINGSTIQEKMVFINENNIFVKEVRNLTNLMDWIVVGLNGNITPYKNFSYSQLIKEQELWHEELGAGEAKIDYKEKNDIIIDFRQNDEGFYWVNLGTKNCPEESERMGHCGRSSGYLYSLRSYKKINNNHTLNESHLTAAITSDGYLMQLKGKHNEKPDPKYHKYIIDLFTFINDDGTPLIRKYGEEYDDEYDFDLKDLNSDDILKIWKVNKELFKSRAAQRKLYDLGLIQHMPKLEHTIVLDAYDISKLVDNIDEKEVTKILEFNYFDNIDLGHEWRNYLDTLNSQNEKTIINFLSKNYGYDNELSLTDNIEENDTNDEIKDRMRWAYESVYVDMLNKEALRTLKNAIEEFSDYVSHDENSMTIVVDFEYLAKTNNISDKRIDEVLEDENYVNALEELQYRNDIDTPSFKINEYFDPYVSSKDFNDVLTEYLFEI